MFLTIFSTRHNIYAQDFVCGMPDSTSYRPYYEKGGEYIISEGEVRALVIFIQFSDDTTTSSGWTLTNPPSLPAWANDVIGETQNGEYKGITQYFDEMSKVNPTEEHGIYKVTGDVYPQVYVPQHPESYYIANGKLEEVSEEVLTALDPYIDYSLYDNCSGNHPGSDGVVDMIYLVFRNFSDDLNVGDWTGSAKLFLSNDLILDGVKIKKDYPGSGITQRGALNGYTYTKYVMAHEYGHYLFGGGHIMWNGNLCLMSYGAWNSSRGMHAVEKERLDWLDYQDKTSDDIIYVSDYMTTNDVYRIPLYDSYGTLKEYYLIENRQKISEHDWAGDKGIYIYHVTHINQTHPDIDVMCADGNWHFTFHTNNLTITRDYEDRNSIYDEMNYRYNYNDKRYICAVPYYPENAAWGDEEDAFDLSFNNVFSPVSNPRSHNPYRDFTVEIEDSIGDPPTYKVRLYFTNPYAGKPSKVINFKANFNGLHPQLNWDRNLEPDLKGYKVYKKLVLSDGSSRISSFFTTDTFYVDYDFDLTRIKFGGNDYAEYWVVSVDNNNNTSAETKHYGTNGSSHIQWKPLVQNGDKKSNVVSLIGNYPNPFNPTTKIKYKLSRKEKVKLAVYNILGQELKVLVNNIPQEPGEYEVTFDANDLASGIYYYRLIVGNKIQSGKMILMK